MKKQCDFSWINLHKRYSDRISSGGFIYESRERAVVNTDFPSYLTTIQIEWEEEE